MIETDFAIAQGLDLFEYRKRLELFDELIPKMLAYIRAQASACALKSPTVSVGEEDFVSIGYIETWVAVLRWDGSSPLVDWAKRLVWTRMNLILRRLYRQKRTVHVISGGSSVTFSTLSLSDIDVESLYDVRPDSFIESSEMYSDLCGLLLRRDQRLEVAILRLLVFPDAELLTLCEANAQERKRINLRITNRCIAERLGVSTPRVANARVVIRRALEELVG